MEKNNHRDSLNFALVSLFFSVRICTNEIFIEAFRAEMEQMKCVELEREKTQWQSNQRIRLWTSKKQQIQLDLKNGLGADV